jgi:ribosome-associated toxin RatA of RatAB toxin-antitoxin module
MADSTTQSITVDAPPEAIMAVIADFPAYPEWADAVKTAEVVTDGPGGRAAEVAFRLETGMFSDNYTLAYDWAPGGLSVSWRLVKGQMQKAQHGTYALAPAAAGTTVTYTLSVELSIPMIGMLRRKAEKIIIDTALKELKRRVER